MNQAATEETRAAWAFAPPNFALAKYWGKSDAVARHPAVPSVSVCVEGLEARASVEFLPDDGADEIFFGGEPADSKTSFRVGQVLDAVRQVAGTDSRARVKSWSDFAVAAGLASSAAGLAAVAGAAWRAAGLSPDSHDEISGIARLGSGSACRSVHGGYVSWEPAEGGSRVRHLAPASHWPLEISVAMVDPERKKVGSTEAMAHCAASSPTWAAWLETARSDAREVESAVLAKDFERLADVAEANCLLMHATTMTARPPILYFQGLTLALFHRIRGLRAQGHGCFFSADAGPNVMIFSLPGEREAIVSAIGAAHPDLRIIKLKAGMGLRYGTPSGKSELNQ